MAKSRHTLLAFAMSACMTATAADTLKVKSRSRAMLDATASGYGKEYVQGYYRLDDFRVDFKANYGRYELKADIGLGGGSGISGGEEKDLSPGVNLYLNKYIGLKLNGSYVWVGAIATVSITRISLSRRLESNMFLIKIFPLFLAPTDKKRYLRK